MEGSTEIQKTTCYSRGTPGYRAPELLELSGSQSEKSVYSKKSDIWALGCIFYELTFSKQLFVSDLSARDWAVSGRELELPFEYLPIDQSSATMFEVLLRRMLLLDPIHRPTINNLCEQLHSCAILAPWNQHAPTELVLPGPSPSNSNRLIVAIDFGIAL
jgi:serine/threonine protein kinase